MKTPLISDQDLDRKIALALASSPIPPGLEATLAEVDTYDEPISTEIQERLDEMGEALVKRFARRSR